MMTNDQREINHSEQAKWFETFYMQQDPMKYRVWLVKEKDESGGAAIGYFAAKEGDGGYYITEGVLEAKRGIGVGSFMLKTLISNENFKNGPLYADIFNSNLASIRLHEKFGFQKHMDVGNHITRFVKRSC